jgi:hypothetical protein
MPDERQSEKVPPWRAKLPQHLGLLKGETTPTDVARINGLKVVKVEVRRERLYLAWKTQSVRPKA